MRSARRGLSKKRTIAYSGKSWRRTRRSRRNGAMCERSRRSLTRRSANRLARLTSWLNSRGPTRQTVRHTQLGWRKHKAGRKRRASSWVSSRRSWRFYRRSRPGRSRAWRALWRSSQLRHSTQRLSSLSSLHEWPSWSRPRHHCRGSYRRQRARWRSVPASRWRTSLCRRRSQYSSKR